MKIKTWQEHFFRPVNAFPLSAFRIAYGILLFWQTSAILNPQYVQENFVKSIYYFPYSIFDFFHIGRLSTPFIHGIFMLLWIAAICITFGVFFRLATIIFFLSYSYIFFIEKSFYSELHYLILLLSFLFMFINADASPSLTQSRREAVPFWQIFILRAQFIIVYFYGGISKLDIDWLMYAQPVCRILEGKVLWGFDLHEPWVAYAISYGGIFLDLAIALLLIRGRMALAFLGILIFNLTNYWLFDDISIFPMLMIAATILFLNEKEIPGNNLQISDLRRQLTFGFICLYLLFQCLIPLRHWLYPGYVGWNMEGGRFAWRMKMDAKVVRMKIVVAAPQTQRHLEINYHHFLTPNQLWVDNFPDMLIQLVHNLKRDLFPNSKSVRIYVSAEASLNQRPFQPYIDGTVNFAETSYPLGSHAEWILPFKNIPPRPLP